MKKYIKYLVVLLFVAGFNSGCEDFLSPSVEQNKPTEEAIETTQDLESTVNGVYDDLNRVELYGRDYFVSLDVMTDNAFSNENSGRFGDQDRYTTDIAVSNGYPLGLWDVFYESIATANLAINADLESSGDVDHLKGQAYALRAFSHFNLLMTFGQQYVDGGDPNDGVPYKTEYHTAETASEEDMYPERDAIATVWDNIEQDLNMAVDLLDDERVDRTELDYWATRALQVRYYLYRGQYDQVVPIAEEIINSGLFEVTSRTDLLNYWERQEKPSSLFELAFTGTDRLSIDNIARIYRPTNYGDIEVSEDLYTAHESDDVRLDLYGAPGEMVETLLGPVELEGYRMVSKFADELGSENVPVVRYPEVLLSYAEALAQGETGEMTAQEAINMVADKRYENGSPYTTDPTVDEVLHERRLELAMEGHRMYDLLRTGRDIPATNGVVPHGDYHNAMPIPDSEIRANSNMTQNEGWGN